MKSLVADFVLMASKGAPEELNEDVFNHAVEFMRTMAEEDPIGTLKTFTPPLLITSLVHLSSTVLSLRRLSRLMPHTLCYSI